MSDLTREHPMRRKVGECPVCRGYLWGEVIVRTSIADEPYWSDNIERPSISASAVPVAMTLAHDCDKREASA